MNLHRFAIAGLCGVVITVASACSAVTHGSATQRPASEAQTTISTPKEGLESVTVIDVRTPEEYADGHLDGAVNIDIYAEDFAQQIQALDPNVSYGVYCRSGSRSAQAVDYMTTEGFTSVTDLGSREAAAETLSLPIVK